MKRRVLRFGITGLVVTGVHVLVAAGLIRFLRFDPKLANGVAFVIATALSYGVNTLWSFSSPIGGSNFVRFISVSTVGLLLTLTFSGAAQYLGLHYIYGILVVVCTVPLVTFLLHHFWTYRKVPGGSFEGLG